MLEKVVKQLKGDTIFAIPIASALNIPDSQIISSLRQGDEEVFEMIFRTYYQRLCNYANSILDDMEEAEEMVQSAFVTVWEKHPTLEIHTSVKSYLYKAVYNSCLNRVKHYKVRMKHNNHVLHTADIFDADASQNLIKSELEELTRRSIEALPPQCQVVFKLSRFENMTYIEIAQQLDISVKTVENHIARALKSLRQDLKDFLPIMICMFIVNN
jgi:RNA polymerase sigma-70 factor (family 1)